MSTSTLLYSLLTNTSYKGAYIMTIPSKETNGRIDLQVRWLSNVKFCETDIPVHVVW